MIAERYESFPEVNDHGKYGSKLDNDIEHHEQKIL